MAFGSLITNGTGSLTGITLGASNVIPINGGTGVTVKRADMYVVLICEQGGPSATSTTNSLGGGGVFTNTGTFSNGVSGRVAHGTLPPGTITSVTVNCTINSPNNDFSMVAAVFEGPFRLGAVIDKNVANTTGDLTSPFDGPATGTLTYPDDLVIGWSANNNIQTWSGSNLAVAVQASQTNTHAVLGYLAASSTASIAPRFTTASGVPTANVMGTTTYVSAAPTVRRVGRNTVLVEDRRNVWL